MQHNNGFSIIGAFLSGFGSIVAYFEQNTGVILAVVGLLSWASGVFFQRRKDRRDAERHEMERIEHAHRLELLRDGRYVKAETDENDNDGT